MPRPNHRHKCRTWVCRVDPESEKSDGNLFGDCGTTKLRLGKGLRFEVIVKRGVIRHGGINLDDYMQS
jgi:hypothetical protein